MPISSITQVLLRLVALNWLCSSIVQVIGSGFVFQYSKFSISAFAAPMVLFVCAILCWNCAPRLARLFSSGNDEAFTLQGVSLHNLYSTAFVGLGAYFALGSFGRMFNWLHYYTISKTGNPAWAPPSSVSPYNVSEPAMTFIAGIFLVATANIWARKLTSKKTSEQSHRADSGNTGS